MIHEIIPLYPDRQDVTLTTYILDKTHQINNGQALPAVLICPGGAYLYTSIREGEAIALEFNRMGYHAFVLDYSTYYGKKENIEAQLTMPARPEVQFPAPMVEIAMAMNLIKKQADKWGVAVDKLGLAGFSAGAHNVAMFANQFEDPQIEFPQDIDLAELKPAFMIIGYGLFDLGKAQVLAQNNPQAMELAQVMMQATMGQTKIEADSLRKWSPVYHINASTPPAFIWTTGQDETVAASDSIDFALAMYQAGRPCEFHLYEKGPHGLSTAGPNSASEDRHINAHVSTWLTLVNTWLENLFTE